VGQGEPPQRPPRAWDRNADAGSRAKNDDAFLEEVAILAASPSASSLQRLGAFPSSVGRESFSHSDTLYEEPQFPKAVRMGSLSGSVDTFRDPFARSSRQLLAPQLQIDCDAAGLSTPSDGSSGRFTFSSPSSSRDESQSSSMRVAQHGRDTRSSPKSSPTAAAFSFRALDESLLTLDAAEARARGDYGVDPRSATELRGDMLSPVGVMEDVGPSDEVYQSRRSSGLAPELDDRGSQEVLQSTDMSRDDTRQGLGIDTLRAYQPNTAAPVPAPAQEPAEQGLARSHSKRGLLSKRTPAMSPRSPESEATLGSAFEPAPPRPPRSREQSLQHWAAHSAGWTVEPHAQSPRTPETATRRGSKSSDTTPRKSPAIKSGFVSGLRKLMSGGGASAGSPGKRNTPRQRESSVASITATPAAEEVQIVSGPPGARAMYEPVPVHQLQSPARPATATASPAFAFGAGQQATASGSGPASGMVSRSASLRSFGASSTASHSIAPPRPPRPDAPRHVRQLSSGAGETEHLASSASSHESHRGTRTRTTSIDSMRARVLMHSRAGDRLSGAGSVGPDGMGRRSRTSSRSSVIEHVGHEEARRRSGLQGPVLLGSANKITRPHTRAGGASSDLVEVLDAASGEPRFVEQAPLRPPRAGDVRPGSSQSAMAFLDSPNVASNFNHAHTQRWSTLGSPGGPSSGMFARRGSETSARFSRRGSDASSVATPEPSPRYASGARGLHAHSPIGHIEELRGPALVTASVDDLRSGVLSPSPLAPHGAESLVRSGSARRSRLSSADGLANRPERRSFVNTGSKRWSGLFGGNGSQRKITASNISRPTSVSSSALSDAAADMLARPFEDSSPRSANFGVTPAQQYPARVANRSSTATSRASSTRGTDNTEDESREMMPSDELRAIVNRNRSGSSASTHSSAMSPPPWAMPISPGVAARHSVASRRPSTSDAIGSAYPMANAYYAPTYTPPIHSSLSSVSADRSWAARPASANEAPNASSLGRRPSGFDAAAFDATAAFESIPSPHPVRGEDDAAPQDVDDDEDSVLDEDAGTGSSPARSLRDERPHTPPQQIMRSRSSLTPFQGGRPLPTDAPRSPGAGFDDPEVELLEDDCDAAAPPADGSDDLDGARIGLTTMPLGRSSVLVRSRSNEALRGVADAVSRAAGQDSGMLGAGRCDRRSYAYV
jgi:hypothetical protein